MNRRDFVKVVAVPYIALRSPSFPDGFRDVLVLFEWKESPPMKLGGACSALAATRCMEEAWNRKSKFQFTYASLEKREEQS